MFALGCTHQTLSSKLKAKDKAIATHEGIAAAGESPNEAAGEFKDRLQGLEGNKGKEYIRGI